MEKKLWIGKTVPSGKPFGIPYDFVGHTLACIGVRGSGKTVAATVIAEEMSDAGLAFTSIDPVGVWWGLRCDRDGGPGGYQVVIVGGEHADIPLHRDMGAAIADATTEGKVSCVIDMSQESKNDVRRFVTDYCDRLMALRPDYQRHIFLEEAPELVPQKPMGEQKRSRAAVDRLMRLGRNRGYGGTLISQRFATIDKDVLTQGCESILALRTIGKHDRDAVGDWIGEVIGETESKKKADDLMHSLAQLPSGEGFFWSPEWLDEFQRIKIRERKTFHPGATRKFGETAKHVELLNVKDFVDLFKSKLRPPAAPKSYHGKSFREEGVLPLKFSSARAAQADEDAAMVCKLNDRIAEVTKERDQALTELKFMRASIEGMKEALRPQFDAYSKLFEGFAQHVTVAKTFNSDSDKYAAWRPKLNKSSNTILDLLLQHGTLSVKQLSVLMGVTGRSVQTALVPLNRASFLSRDGNLYSLS